MLVYQKVYMLGCESQISQSMVYFFVFLSRIQDGKKKKPENTCDSQRKMSRSKENDKSWTYNVQSEGRSNKNDPNTKSHTSYGLIKKIPFLLIGYIK